jgi:hypothetical protein
VRWSRCSLIFHPRRCPCTSSIPTRATYRHACACSSTGWLPRARARRDSLHRKVNKGQCVIPIDSSLVEVNPRWKPSRREARLACAAGYPCAVRVFITEQILGLFGPRNPMIGAQDQHRSTGKAPPISDDAVSGFRRGCHLELN